MADLEGAGAAYGEALDAKLDTVQRVVKAVSDSCENWQELAERGHNHSPH